ncbi:MAG: hypothetical protein J0H84_20340 [Rhizobiales bacterium]|nr:hypothetical protein [Hyphomicrobiales bacterium]
MPRAKKAAAAADSQTISAYKGFNADWSCQGFQYAIGETYRHEGDVKCCPQEDDLRRGAGGFHACEHPLNVFSYYAPATSVFAAVELGGQTDRESGGDTKIATAEITIRAELKLPELIAAAIKYVFDRAKWVDGDHTDQDGEGVRSKKEGGAATASGIRGAATASGDWGAATASGDWGAATASGIRGAATASGIRGAATASGDQGAATASGYQGKVRGKEGCALFLVERSGNGEIINVWAGIAGRDGVDPETFYRLQDGKPVKAE